VAITPATPTIRSSRHDAREDGLAGNGPRVTGAMAGIASEYVDLAERVAARVTLPRVRALHLPVDDAPAGKDAEFCVLELEDGACGFTYVWLGDTLREIKRGGFAAGASGRDAVELARCYASPDPAARAIGMAAINAISQHLFARAGWTPGDAGDSIGQLDPTRGEHIGMVGLFPKLVPQVLESGARLTVLELKAQLAGAGDGYRVTLDPAELAGCEKVVSTSTVLLNDTLDDVLAACRGAHYFAMIGPTAGGLPDPLFARGVHAVGGAQVTDVDAFLAAFRAGEPWGRFTRKYAIRRDDYPGVEWLLVRAV
jgi:uncharacterized protein